MYSKSPQLWGSYRESRYEMALPLTSCSFIAKLVFGPVCYNAGCSHQPPDHIMWLLMWCGGQSLALWYSVSQSFGIKFHYQLFLEGCFIAIRFIYYSHLLLIFLCASVLKPAHWEMDVSQLEYTVFTCRLRESFEFNALIIWGVNLFLVIRFLACFFLVRLRQAYNVLLKCQCPDPRLFLDSFFHLQMWFHFFFTHLDIFNLSQDWQF